MIPDMSHNLSISQLRGVGLVMVHRRQAPGATVAGLEWMVV